MKIEFDDGSSLDPEQVLDMQKWEAAIDVLSGDWVHFSAGIPEALVAIGDYTPVRNTWSWVRSWQIRSVEQLEDRIVQDICELPQHNEGNRHSFEAVLSEMSPIPSISTENLRKGVWLQRQRAANHHSKRSH